MKTNKTEVPKKYPYVDEENNWLYLNHSTIVINKKFKMRWSPSNKKHYVDLGYDCNDWHTLFDVNVQELMKRCGVKVDTICPKCKKEHGVLMFDLTKRGHTKCGGCARKTCKIGLVYGEWTVLREAERDNSGAIYYWCQCSCGRIRRVGSRNLQNGRSTKCRNNHEKTAKERAKKSDYYNFTLPVYERDNFTCQVTGDTKGGNLEAHHLNGRKDFINQTLDIDNGITIRKDIHKQFHVDYMGHYQNGCTEQDFINFCLEFYPDALFLKQYQIPT